ncbi:MAG TPA: cell division protein FtsZ [Firmicutes bacterium]|nr:cell division protein FtsZ [Bacillota bacterium]
MDNFNFDPSSTFAKIKVIGIGGAGSNAVNRMIDDMIDYIDYYVMNTDAQALSTSRCKNQIALGKEYTKGLGAGGDPEVGKKAALQDIDDIKELVKDTNLVFIAAGMGGGTGTGAAPVVAKAAKDAGALTIAIVTRPFDFEGESRKVKAIKGINELKSCVDAYIIVSNNSLMNSNGNRPLGEAFAESDRVLSQSVKTITDLIVLPGIINLDFADVKNTLKDKGLTMIGFGMGAGEKKSIEAATNAFSSPLLEASIKGAHSAIINVIGGHGVTLADASDAVDYIREVAGNNLNIIFGVQQNPKLEDEMLVSIIATEFDSEYSYDDNKSLITNRVKPESNKEVSSPVVGEKTTIEVNEEESILPSFLDEIRKKTGEEKSITDEEREDNEEEINDLEKEEMIN